MLRNQKIRRGFFKLFFIFIPGVISFYWVFIRGGEYYGTGLCEFKDSAIKSVITERLEWHNEWFRVRGSKHKWPTLMYKISPEVTSDVVFNIEVGDSISKDANSEIVNIMRGSKKYRCKIPTRFCKLQFF